MDKTILYIHQSSELYGSDKTLLYLVKEVNKHPYFNVIVLLPSDGPLKDILVSENIRVIISPVIKITRKSFTIGNILILPFKILRQTYQLNKKLKGVKIDLVHSNTVAVLLGAFFAKRYRIRHLWHIHEIIKKPKVVSKVFPFLVDKLSNIVVYNSKASKLSLCHNHRALEKKSIVILNGLQRDKDFTKLNEILRIRKQLFSAESEDIVLGLIGRINKWKGHHLLLETFYELQNSNAKLKLVFVGSTPPNQEHFVNDLDKKIKFLKLENKIKIIPFQENIWSIWDSIDIAIVPSTEPEPFGLVAVEAMLSKKPVIAAKHGGLIEIIKQNETGYFFEPNDKKDLLKVINRLIKDNNKITDFGQKGYEVAIDQFSLHRYVKSFISLYDTFFVYD